MYSKSQIFFKKKQRATLDGLLHIIFVTKRISIYKYSGRRADGRTIAYVVRILKYAIKVETKKLIFNKCDSLSTCNLARSAEYM